MARGRPARSGSARVHHFRALSWCCPPSWPSWSLWRAWGGPGVPPGASGASWCRLRPRKPRSPGGPIGAVPLEGPGWAWSACRALPAPSSSGSWRLSGPPLVPRSGRPAPRCRRCPCRRGGRPARAARASAPRGQGLGRGGRRRPRHQSCDRRGGRGPAGDDLGRRRRLDRPPGCLALSRRQAAPHALAVGRRQALGPDRAAGAQRPGRRVVGPGAVLAVLGVEGRRPSSPAGRLQVPGRPPQLDHASAR